MGNKNGRIFFFYSSAIFVVFYYFLSRKLFWKIFAGFGRWRKKKPKKNPYCGRDISS
ncbi:hypothetical protein BY458DRAFT_497400 [Sporodiniella umbellata]|nr:hypothetical protein BY458DRAFT_497400 [Sporodiniella umbellata]